MENDRSPVRGASLDQVSLLQGLPRAAISELESVVRWQRHKSGEQILTRDASGCDAFFVVKGTVRVVSYSASGREVSYAVISEGGYFGELAAIDSRPRSANCVAEADCLLACVPPDVFRNLLARHPGVALRVIEKLTRIIRDCDERILDLATLGAYQRVYREILKRAKPDPVRPSSWLVYPLPTQLDIASYASTTRETVARVISSLTQAQICSRKGKTLYIRDRNQLEQLINRTDLGFSSG